MIGTYYFFLVLGVLAVVLLLEGLFMAWNAHRGPQSRNIARRLELLSAGAHGEATGRELLKRRELSQAKWLDRLLVKVPRVSAVDRFLVQSGTGMSVATLAGLTLAAAVLAILGLRTMGLGWFMTLAGTLPIAALPALVVLNERQKRIDKIDSQLPDALDLIGRALRAGHAFQGAMHMVATEAPEPVAAEFRITFDEINFGVPLDAALLNLATRVPSTDLRYFVIAVLIHRETGGNLAELLDNLSHLMRERIKLRGTIKVLSAEGKLSAWILALLPFGLAGLLNAMNPDFMSILFTDEGGRRLLATALVLMVIGIIWLWRLTKIRV